MLVKMPKIYSCLLLFMFCAPAAISENNLTDYSHRKERLLGLFQIIKFPNSPCSASDNKNGTCYSKEECGEKGGLESGICAEGYGVCCVFTIKCFEKSHENATYFSSEGGESGTCCATICKLNSNICQLRLDFDTFVISGPNAEAGGTLRLLNGNPASAAGVPATTATVCNTDSFAVVNTGGFSPSAICGTNSGEHMYTEISSDCIMLVFLLGAGATISRSWQIKVSQYSCDYPNLAPDGCTQYYFDPSKTGTVRSYNFQSGYHLALQNHNICIRREMNSCRICWYALSFTDFQLSGSDAVLSGLNSPSCCGYSGSGLGTLGYDCVMIPSASTGSNLIDNSAFCGRSEGLVNPAGTSKTVCSKRTPFELRFLSDGFETVGEATNPDMGFELQYELLDDCS